jgi:hypothetical protein
VSCEVEGLRTVMNYALRMKEVCTDTLLDSAWSEAPLIDLTLPFGALEPEQVRCHNRTYESMVARWLPGDARDCIFDAWEVQLRLMPRGEEGAPGPWMPGCVVRDREDASCSLQGLLSDRDYQVQVRELCADPSANSLFSLHDGACITEELAAEAPYNVTVRDATVNPTTFQVSWTGADPRACVFAGWELQAVEQSRDWPPEWTSTTSTTTTTTTSTSSRAGIDHDHDGRSERDRERDRERDPAVRRGWLPASAGVRPRRLLHGRGRGHVSTRTTSMAEAAAGGGRRPQPRACEIACR